MATKADQEKFELTVIKKYLPLYMRTFRADRVQVQHVNTLERLSNLEGFGRPVGSYKEIKTMTIGGLLNSFQKSGIRVALDAFLKQEELTEESDWEFVFSITSSTALYVLMPYEPEMAFCDGVRFTASVRYRYNMLTLIRLDNYLKIKWREYRDED